MNVTIVDLHDEVPFFTWPLSNLTQVRFENSNPVYVFEAIDLDLNETISFSLVNQTSVFKNEAVNLPFALNSSSGELSFSSDKLTSEDLVSLLNQTESKRDVARIKVDVAVSDSTNKR